MKIKQIGNGGAFNYEQPNSAFLVKLNTKTILVDCGYSVYSELRRLDSLKEINLKDIRAVYITHMDDDHIGSLKTLLYYQYYINGIVMDVLYDSLLIDFKKYMNLKEFNTITVDYKYKKQTLVNLIPIQTESFLNYDDVKIRTFSGEHHVPVFGIIFNKTLAITGDTRPTKFIEEKLKDVDYIFHDFSNWNEPSRQEHTCLDSLNATYSEEFINKLRFYHNDTPFNKEWLNLGENK